MNDEMTFEQARDELEAIVRRLEDGQTSLDDALKLWERGEGIHAGEGETSEILFLRPETVRMDAAVPPTVSQPRISTLDALGATYVKWWHHFTDTGGVGDPTAASAEKGGRFLEASADVLGAFLKEFSDAPVGERFPF